MALTGWLTIVLLAVAIVALGVLIYALVEAVGTMRAVRKVAEDVEATMPGLVEKADVAIDSFNVQMLRLDAIVDQVEEVSARVSRTATLVHEVANVPATAANVAGERLRTVWNRMKRERG